MRSGIAATTVTASAAVIALGFGVGPADGSPADRGPIATTLHTVDFQPSGEVGRPGAAIPSRTTKRFSLVGVTWNDPYAEVKGTIKIRTRAITSGRWSDWQELDAGRHLGPEPGSKEGNRRLRGGTDPLWVGPSDGVEVRVVTDSGQSSKRLPPGLRLDLVDPGDAGKAGTAGSGSGPAQLFKPVAYVPQQSMAQAEPADIINPIPMPSLLTRADWRADESIVKDPPDYGTTVNAVFVHHTAGSNTYSCAESAAIVRAIQTYHVKSNGWNDIGYNFLVDKCGTLFEGRAGGVDRPVVGAHTYGFNTNNAGIAVLGTYITAGVTDTVQNVLAHLSAYKLGQYGFDPAGQVTLVAGLDTGKHKKGEAVLMYRISGHRDGVPTECPGEALYAQLPLIRQRAGYVSRLAINGISGANKSGTTYYTKGTITPTWSLGTPTQLMDRFEILVDGNVAATAAATARSAAVTLTPGSHRVQVRGVHRNGRTATTAGQAVVADMTAPRFTRAPNLGLRKGTVSATSVPVSLTWQAADNAALRSVALTSPKTATFAPTTTGWSTTAKPGISAIWSMRASDWAGNTATASATRTPVLVSESSSTRSGTWSRVKSTAYLGGYALTSKARGASISWTFTGRSVGLIASRTPTSGQIYIYVDGVKVSTVDLKSSTTAHRQIVWTRTWSTSAKHTVKIVVVGTLGRPRITTDGIVYIK
ncbi:MAG TPA: peptidoglycan recognition protein [Micromonosporaceae bacterium]|nr:peptidoglycan recognition protein [Micromonosporaceae bacterium]